jgi:hypothetical protein
MRQFLLGLAYSVVITLFVLIVVPIFCLAFAWPLSALWNFAVVPTFRLPALTFWKAWALQLVVSLFVGRGASNSVTQAGGEVAKEYGK